MKKAVFLLLVAGWCILISCKSRENPYANELGIDPSLMAEMDMPNYTEITWLDTLVDLGRINTKDTVRFSFRYRNTGGKPLFIIKTRTTCGCTVGEFSKEPIWENEEGVIRVRYLWNGDTGTFRKHIAVHTNTINGNWHRLAFTGIVATDTTQQP
jgi:hypothetical protein